MLIGKNHGKPWAMGFALAIVGDVWLKFVSWLNQHENIYHQSSWYFLISHCWRMICLSYPMMFGFPWISQWISTLQAPFFFTAGLGERRTWLPPWTSEIQVLEVQTVLGGFRGIHQSPYMGFHGLHIVYSYVQLRHLVFKGDIVGCWLVVKSMLEVCSGDINWRFEGKIYPTDLVFYD